MIFAESKDSDTSFCFCFFLEKDPSFEEVLKLKQMSQPAAILSELIRQV
jgi:hypothetical protein